MADKSEAASAISENRDIKDGTKEGADRLEKLTPEERRDLLEEVKLTTPLRTLLEKRHQGGAPVTVEGVTLLSDGQLLVQIWLNASPADMAAQFKAAGFQTDATLKPGKLILGRITPDKLDALLALSFVRYIEQPKITN